ncbi:YibL family ribosome-associated protein [Alkalimarinus coralli]|uniref:YibL family ribosome-associated protein n=1 Tax=Alkalimarinus coralli TaxID=2935863 RepID=UPI00202B445B|nr:YibL family ribosome-associated protein [Alkalimarinus coralli]
MNLKQELQQLNNKLDKTRRKFVAAEKRFDQEIIAQSRMEIAALTKQIESLKNAQANQISSKGGKIKSMAFSRPLTKSEQADMGKLKKSVKGLVVVHPLTALGREIGVSEVTGFAPKAF